MHTNDDFFRVIGKISVMFATWDMFVSDLIVRLRPGQPPLFNERSTLGQKLLLLENLKPADVCDPKLLAELAAHMSKAKQVAGERNRYIHDQWLFDKDLIAGGRIRRCKLSFKPEVHADWKELTIQELESFADELWKVQGPFTEAAQRLHPGFFHVSSA